MSAKKPVVVYGVSGYTGRLICEYLREFNVPFIAAGRDKKRTQEVVDMIPGLDTVEHEVVEVEHTVEALTELFSGAQVVCNTVGPFIKYGPEVVEASLAAGCHYLDTTGEQDWVMDAESRWGQGFADKGLLLAPSIAQMYTTGEIAANIALETPGLDTLDILVLWKGFPTQASTQTIFTILKADWFYLEQNQYVQWPLTSTYEVNVPGQHEHAIAVPWGGTSHPVWFKNDPRVANCQGHRRRAQPRGDGGRRRHRRRWSRSRSSRCRPTSRRRRCRRSPHRLPARCRLGRTPGSTPRSTRCTRPGRWPRRTASSTATPTTSRPVCCRPMRRTRCCSSRRSAQGSLRAARRSGTASSSACCAASVW